MDIKEMQRRKRELGYTNERIAELSGVPLSTVQKVLSKATPSPRYGTMCALTDFFNREVPDFYNEDDNGTFSIVSDNEQEYYSSVHGTAALKLSSNEDKTVEDYYNLPPNIRVELIDGVFYDMASPSSVHQLIEFFG